MGSGQFIKVKVNPCYL